MPLLAFTMVLLLVFPHNLCFLSVQNFHTKTLFDAYDAWFTVPRRPAVPAPLWTSRLPCSYSRPPLWLSWQRIPEPWPPSARQAPQTTSLQRKTRGMQCLLISGLFVCLNVCLFVCVTVCLILCLFAWFFVCLFDSLFDFCLFVCLILCLFVCLVWVYTDRRWWFGLMLIWTLGGVCVYTDRQRWYMDWL